MAMREIGFASILGIAAFAFTEDSGWLFHGRSDSPETLQLGSHLAAAALRRGGGSACEPESRCDKLTGCIAPSPPPGPILRVLPEGGKYDRYIRDLRAFQACREPVLLSMKPRKSNVQLVGFDQLRLEEDSFASTVQRWNGDVFWEPASESSNVVTRFGDEARAVFGPIPDGDCADSAAKALPVEVDGNIVELKPNPGKTGHPLEFEHKDAAGNIVKWTDSITRCDKPSLAGNVSYCGLNSRLNRVVRGNVEWLFFCRKSTASLEVQSDPYWLQANPKFALFGTIGFNSQTGEIVFFDGRKDRDEFDWSRPFVPPGGHSYSDKDGRAAAEALYDPTFQIQCYACHDNKNAYVIDPHAQQARVGYLGGESDSRAIAFSLGDYLPATPRREDAPFRVIGSGYTSTYSVELGRAKTVQDPTGNCTSCHTLTTQITGQRFAPDAVAQEPWISNPTWAQLLELLDERMKHSQIADHRTDWALRSGDGKIHPWMVPEDGNELAALRPGLSSAEWRKLSDCLWDAGGSECGYQPLYTPCPAPGSGPQGDGSEPTDAAVAVLPLPAGETAAERVLRVSWRYLNRYGNVPKRDDVRFNVALRETAIPPDRKAPAASDYPSMDETKGKNFMPIDGQVGTSGSAKLVQNISHVGHVRGTEPTASTDLRDFRIDLPGTCNRRYLVRILPKRFCFDQSNVAYSAADHLLYADVLCD
jgi:hypothetical protein